MPGAGLVLYTPFAHLDDCPIPPRFFNCGIGHIVYVRYFPCCNLRHNPALPYHLNWRFNAVKPRDDGKTHRYQHRVICHGSRTLFRVLMEEAQCL